jgi:hypothetical protein
MHDVQVGRVPGEQPIRNGHPFRNSVTERLRAVRLKTQRHGGAVAALCLIGCLLAPLSFGARWLRDDVLDTNGYVAAVGPVAAMPAVRDAVADTLADALTARADAGLRDSPRGVVAAPLRRALPLLVERLAHGFVDSPEFVTIWSDANRVVHATLRALLIGKGVGPVKVVNNEVMLDLGPALTAVMSHLAGMGIPAAERQRPVSLTVPITRIRNLQRARGMVRWLDRLAGGLPVLTALTLGAAAMLTAAGAWPLPRFVALTGIGLAVTMTVLVGGLVALRSVVTADRPSNRLAAVLPAALFDHLTAPLRHAALLTAAAALAAAAAAAIAIQWSRRAAPPPESRHVEAR